MKTIDESLYSRQIYVLGSEAMQKMNQTNVFIYGFDGFGVEIAKNIILGGLNSVTIYDDRTTSIADLSTNYYLTEKDIGVKRASASFKKLLCLNDYVKINLANEPLDISQFADIHILVIVNRSYDDISNIYQLIKTLKIKIICVNVYGLVGSIFCDFGQEFTVYDSNGEDIVQVRLQSIQNNSEGFVYCIDEKRHGLEDGDYVKFSEVEGMDKLNDSPPFKVKTISPVCFSIGDLSKYSNPGFGGIATQIKVPYKISFHNFTHSLSNPSFVISDFEKFDRPPLFHLLFFTLQHFIKIHNRFPLPHNLSDANLFIQYSHQLNGQNTPKVEKLDEKLIKIFCYQSSGSLCPMASYFGGFVAQEVFKAATGKFSPNNQTYYYDCFECLPEDFLDLPETDFTPLNCRYDSQLAVFGKNIQNLLSNLKIFIVGSGAIGCEHIKNLTLMGVGSGHQGSITVTDMDNIERSNLNRQFLFRSSDIGRFKSEAACQTAKRINPEINFIPLLHRVGNETEKIFDDYFYKPLDIVLNALDNIEARTYVDQKCVLYLKPLIESGTLGPKGSVQVVVPHMTESYSSSYDPPEKSIPMCTLKNFPYLPEHTIQWARDMFEGLFCQWPTLLKNFIENPSSIRNQYGMLDDEKLKIIKNSILLHKTTCFTDCIKWAKQIAKKHFGDEIQQLIYSFPKDKLTDHGVPFWSGTKRFPHLYDFDNPESEIYPTFILTATKLRAYNLGIKVDMSDEEILKYSSTISNEKYIPKSNFFIATTDSEVNIQTSIEPEDNNVSGDKDYHLLFTRYIEENRLSITDIIFEKDDDTNHHISFIYSASNLRALNYRIPVSDRLTVKLIAGKIVPAIATTTASTSGLACLEFYKIAQKFDKLACYRNSFINLALAFSTFSEPIKCPTMKFGDLNYTMWDKFEVEAKSSKDPKVECTLEEFLQLVKIKYNADIEMVSHGTCLVYAPFMDTRKRSERLFLPITRTIENITKIKFDSRMKYLLLICTCTTLTDDDNYVDFPPIVYLLP